MFAGFTETFLKNGGQPLLYECTNKRDTNNPDNYSGTSPLNNVYKIYSKMITKRLTVISEALLLEEQ